MQLRNTRTSILRKPEAIILYLYKVRFIIAVLCALVLLLCSCSKAGLVNSATTPILEQYFTSDVLDKNFIVNYASDSSIDITNQYVNDTFMLVYDSVSYFSGPIIATRNNDTTYTGTWSCNSDYSQLVISITSPSIAPEFIFLNRAWKFTEKALPIMKLAPWGTTDPKVLYMERI